MGETIIWLVRWLPGLLEPKQSRYTHIHVHVHVHMHEHVHIHVHIQIHDMNI